MRVDLHVHTAFSFDYWMSLEALVRAVTRNKKVEAIAVLDHDEIEGALRLAEVAPFSTAIEFLENLRQAQIFGRRSPYIFTGLTYIIWCARRFYRRALSHPSI